MKKEIYLRPDGDDGSTKDPKPDPGAGGGS